MPLIKIRNIREALARWWAVDPAGVFFLFAGIGLGAIVLVVLIAMLTTAVAHAAERSERIERLGADGTCVFDGSVRPGIVTADCLTGLYFGQPIAAQVETGSPLVAGWLVSIRPGLLTVALANVSPLPVSARVVVRVSLATPAPAHPCEIPPPELMTMRDRCIQDACAAGIEPICLVKTSEPGTGMPGSD